MTYFDVMPSPIGQLLLVSDGTALLQMSMPNEGRAREPEPVWRRDPGVLRTAREQLQAYFAGELREFDLPLRPEGTPFQRHVWRALCDIPFGTTVSYAELARGIGNPLACRAVGAANGRNPIGIIIPCHRVIGANGNLTGFGGGLPAKKWLIDHELKVLSAHPADLLGRNRVPTFDHRNIGVSHPIPKRAQVVAS